jgi:fatty-acyl-CoA synthase
MRLVGDDGAVAPHDGLTSGHLQVRGPWVASAYFGQEGSGESHADGGFATADIATIDGDGYMQSTDRGKDVIKSGGEWVSSIDRENAAVGHPGVAQAAAIGLPHPKWGARPLLLVVVAPGQSPTREEIAAHLESRIVKWWMPDAIAFIGALPRGATGKVLERTLRERFAEYRFPT